jgi:hypothetical protein
MKHSIFLATAMITLLLLSYSEFFAQKKLQSWILEKMPADLETDYALSALPPHLRGHATVYLLDPKKGYYMERKGTNGFSAFVNRTEFERSNFAPDVYEPISYDSAGSIAYLAPFFDVAAMRASGKFSPSQILDSIVNRVKSGIYKPASRVGVSYMLEPIMRIQHEQGIVNEVMPHYMFYAPYLEDHDIGGRWVTGGHSPFMVNSGEALDKAHSIFNFIIIAAGESEKAKILEDNKDLMRRLAEYKPYLKIETGNVAHQHTH